MHVQTPPLWNQRYDWKQPLRVVKANDITTVRKAFEEAARRRARVSIVSGGHNYEGFSIVHGGIAIDMRDWKTLRIDSDKKTATIGPGWLQHGLYEELKKQGWLMSGGVCEDVSAIGAILGGGTGIFHRLWGLACDNLLQAEVVTPDGEHRVCNPRSEPDLYWACRGAGNGNFGAVVSATVRLYRMERMTSYRLEWLKWDPGVVESWQHWLAHAQRDMASATLDLGGYSSIGPAPMVATGMHRGDEAACRAAVADLIAMHPDEEEFEEEEGPEVGHLATGHSRKDPLLRWHQERAFFSAAAQAGEKFRWKSTGLVSRNVLDKEGAEKLAQKMKETPDSFEGFSVAFVGLRGAVDDPSPTDTPYPHRKARHMLRIVGRWKGAQHDGPNLQFHQHVKDWLGQQLGSRSYYFNYCDLDINDYMQAYFAGNVERLRQVKRTYDPRNRMGYEQGIP